MIPDGAAGVCKRRALTASQPIRLVSRRQARQRSAQVAQHPLGQLSLQADTRECLSGHGTHGAGPAFCIRSNRILLTMHTNHDTT